MLSITNQTFVFAVYRQFEIEEIGRFISDVKYAVAIGKSIYWQGLRIKRV